MRKIHKCMIDFEYWFVITLLVLWRVALLAFCVWAVYRFTRKK